MLSLECIEKNLVNCGYFGSCPRSETLSMFLLLAPSVGQRLCIDFFVSGENFLTTLQSHLDVTCSCYGPIYLMWILTIVNYIEKYLVTIVILTTINYLFNVFG